MITKIDEGVYRGPSPSTAFDRQLLADMGIKYALDLQSGAAIMADGSPLLEALRFDAFRIRTYAHPLGEFFPPTQDELDDAVALMESKKPIYIHCKAGVDRTGMVAAHYRMQVQKWTRATAIDEMKSMGMHIWYTLFWPMNLK